MIINHQYSTIPIIIAPVDGTPIVLFIIITTNTLWQTCSPNWKASVWSFLRVPSHPAWRLYAWTPPASTWSSSSLESSLESSPFHLKLVNLDVAVWSFTGNRAGGVHHHSENDLIVWNYQIILKLAIVSVLSVKAAWIPVKSALMLPSLSFALNTLITYTWFLGEEIIALRNDREHISMTLHVYKSWPSYIDIEFWQ